MPQVLPPAARPDRRIWAAPERQFRSPAQKKGGSRRTRRKGTTDVPGGDKTLKTIGLPGLSAGAERT
jgi:hypothetical protein